MARKRLSSKHLQISRLTYTVSSWRRMPVQWRDGIVLTFEYPLKDIGDTAHQPFLQSGQRMFEIEHSIIMKTTIVGQYNKEGFGRNLLNLNRPRVLAVLTSLPGGSLSVLTTCESASFHTTFPSYPSTTATNDSRIQSGQIWLVEPGIRFTPYQHATDAVPRLLGMWRVGNAL